MQGRRRVSAHATREGTYVALTRAREQTHIYAEEPTDPVRDDDRLQAVAERISRTEPDIPSISIPLADEPPITATPNRSEPVNEPGRPTSQPPDHDHLGTRERPSTNKETALNGLNERDTQYTKAEGDAAVVQEGGLDPNAPGHADQDGRHRRWPRHPRIELGWRQRDRIRDNAASTHTPGWES
jgi:hypothetical protein